MRKGKLIEDAWRSYAERVLPSGASAIQIQECRRAFYGGAAHLFAALGYSIGSDDVSEDEGVAILEGVQAELERYVEAVRAGRR